MKNSEFYMASKYLKSTSNDHISESLKIKLKKWMELNKITSELKQHKKLLARNTMSSMKLNSLVVKNPAYISSSKQLTGNYSQMSGHKSTQKLPDVNTANQIVELESEYGNGKFQQLTGKNELKGYWVSHWLLN